ncbi:MAG: TIGR01777 family oxidoreductase [Thermoleophilaceae bacterium]
MRVAVTGATGTIGRELVEALLDRGDAVTVLTRDVDRAAGELPDTHPVAWRDPLREPAPTEALNGRDAVVHLAGEPIAQRWTAAAKQRIRDSRELGTRNLVAGLREAEPRPRVLVSQSAVGYYGPHGDERIDESAPPASGDFLADAVVAWESEARAAEELGMRVVLTRTGVVLSESGGALAKMLPPFKLGVGGPVAGGRQYVPWIHMDDVVGVILRALDDDSWSGALNVTAPEPVTNRELSRALGRLLVRPAITPVPGFALGLLYGEMGSIVTTGQRAVPGRLLELGYEYRHPEFEAALRAAVKP